MKLSLSNLSGLPATVARPSYDRSELTPGIVHIGIGNFHRAHQAVYLDDLFEHGIDHDWAIVGAGVRDHDNEMRMALLGQDWLSTVVELEPGAYRPRVTGAMIDFAPVTGDGQAIVAALADPRVRIASLTVTEGGYCIDPATGEFDPNHPDIQYDLRHTNAPRGVFGVLLAALEARRAKGLPPFTIMSCDNIPGNGHAARNAVAGLAALRDSRLADFVGGEVAFPNSMVDRITPATTNEQRAFLSKNFGIKDDWPVFCESFRQWVLEDDFRAGRPRFEDAGVTLVSDVEPYELMKLRILNGSHAAIAYPAALLGIHFVHDAMTHPLVRAFLDKLVMEEIIPVVPPVPDISLTNYFAQVAHRFANPEVRDTISRLCQDGSNRQPKFILPTTGDRLMDGLDVTGLALESALWCRYCAGTTDAGDPIKIDDESAARLTEAAHAAREEPLAFLAMDDVFSNELSGSDRFRQRFAGALTSLWNRGTAVTLQSYVSGGLH